MSNVKSFLILCLSILLIIAFIPSTANSHATTYTVGVKAGDWIIFDDVSYEYAGNMSAPPEQVNQTWIHGEILSVDNYNVTAKSIILYKNGTEVTDIAWSNITTGDGGIGLFIIPSDLSAGDRIPENLTMFSDVPMSLTINGTVTRSYAGANREVNYVSLAIPIMWNETTQAGWGNVSFYWDRTSGVLCEQKVSAMANFGVWPQNIYVEMSIAIKLTATNIWPAFSSIVFDSTSYNVTMMSNSTISAFNFNETAKTISLNLTGPESKSGYCNVTFPTELLGGPYTVLIDGLNVTYVEAPNATHTGISVTYLHGTHLVEIVGTTAIPEFPTMMSTIILLAMLTAALLLAKRVKHNKTFL